MAFGDRSIRRSLQSAFLKRKTQNQGLDPASKKARSSGLFGRRLRNPPTNEKPRNPLGPIRPIQRP